MMIDLTDTTTRAIHDALTRARDQMGGPTTGMVLNLIIMTDEAAQYDAVRAATQAGREHPVPGARGDRPGPRRRIPARRRDQDRRGRPGQTVLLRMYGPMGLHADSVVMPLLVPDTPVVTWWPRGGPATPSGEPAGHAGAAPGHRRRLVRRPGRGPLPPWRRATGPATPT